MTISDYSPQSFTTSRSLRGQLGLYICLILSTVILYACSSSDGKSQSTDADRSDKVLMAVFAHPDDEGTVGPILKKYADQGVNVILVTATDGRLGTNEYSDLPAGDTLATVRRGELKCAAEKLGVELIHLDYEDQFKTAGGYDTFIPQSRGLIKDIHRIVSERQPDVILTFGPDGFSNHIDHRLVGATVTHVLVSTDWEKAPDVYYVGSPASLLDDEESKILRGVQEKYLTVRIPYSDEDGEVAMRSMQCHKSQFSPEMVEKRWKERSSERENLVYLRPFVAPRSGTSNDLFE